jgi:sulfur carrier protein
MRATVNGETQELPEGLTVAGLLKRLGLREGRVAVERNGAVVKRARHPDEALADGDVLEVVTFVGGG